MVFISNQAAYSSAVFYPNGLNMLNKSQRLPEWIKNMTTTYCLWEIYSRYNVIGRLKVERWKKIQHANINQRKAQLAISDKMDFRAKNITRNRKDYFSNDKKICLPRRYSSPNCVYTKQQSCKIRKANWELKGEIVKFTITARDFTTLLLIINRTAKQIQQGYRKIPSTNI